MPEMRNYMEIAVNDTMDAILKDFDVCRCEKCRYDIMAITLNSLPPKYAVSDKGQLFTKLKMFHRQYDVDIISAITKAAEIVGKSPRHNENNKTED